MSDDPSLFADRSASLRQQIVDVMHRDDVRHADAGGAATTPYVIGLSTGHHGAHQLAVVEAELDAMVRDGIAEKTDTLYGDRWCLR